MLQAASSGYQLVTVQLTAQLTNIDLYVLSQGIENSLRGTVQVAKHLVIPCHLTILTPGLN